MNWPASVPVVVDGQTTFSANSLNPTINALSTRTDFLKNAFDNLSGNQGYLLPDTGITEACEVGMLVAYIPNSTSGELGGTYVPASAVWSSNLRSDGSKIPDDRAYVKGVLVSKDSSTQSGVILCNGWTDDPDVIAYLASGHEVGDYYLTAEGTGKGSTGNAVTLDMRVYCYSYLASGKLFIRPENPEYAGHSHNHVRITTTWVASTQVTGVTLPSDATYATDLSASPSLNALIEANPNHTCLVKNGTEVMEGLWGIVDTWLYITFSLEVGDVFSLHAITPLTASEPLVRSVTATSSNKLLDITSTGGKVFIGVNNTPTETNAYTGTGVVSLDSNGIKTGPVVQELYAGPGISLGNYVDSATHEVVPGAVTITATQFAGTMIDMNVCNLDRVVMGTSFNGISYVFPQGATSMLIGTMRVPHFDSTTTSGKLVFVFQGNGGSISNLSAIVTIQPIPQTDDTSAATAVATSVTYDVASIGGTNTGYCYRSTLDLGTTIQSDSLLILKLASAGTSGITLVSASLLLS